MRRWEDRDVDICFAEICDIDHMRYVIQLRRDIAAISLPLWCMGAQQVGDSLHIVSSGVSTAIFNIREPYHSFRLAKIMQAPYRKYLSRKPRKHIASQEGLLSV